MNQCQRGFIRSERGGMMINLLLVAGLVMVILGGIASALHYQREDVHRVNAHLSAAMVKANVYSYLTHPVSLENTLKAARNQSTFACLTDTVMGCASEMSKDNPIVVLVDGVGDIIFDSDIKSNGFGLNGAPCNEFSEADGDKLCAFRLELAWTPECVAPCISPENIRLKAKLGFKSKNKHPMNLQDYEINVLHKVN